MAETMQRHAQWVAPYGTVRHLDSGTRQVIGDRTTVIAKCGVDTRRDPAWTLTGRGWMLSVCERCLRMI